MPIQVANEPASQGLCVKDVMSPAIFPEIGICGKGRLEFVRRARVKPSLWSSLALALFIFGECGTHVASAAVTVPTCMGFHTYAFEGDGNFNQAQGYPKFANDYFLQSTFGAKLSEITDADIERLVAAAEKCSGDLAFKHHPQYLRIAIGQLRNLKRLRDQRSEVRQSSINLYLERRKQLESLKTELNALPASVESKEKLSAILQSVRQRMPYTVTDNPGINREQNAAVQLEAELEAAVEEKQRQIVSFERDTRKNEFARHAATLASQKKREIDRFGIPADFLDGRIYLETANNRRFLILRELIALLMEQEGASVAAKRVDDMVGVGIKRPGSRTLTFMFANDGGDLFLAMIFDGDSAHYLQTPLQKARGAQILLEAANVAGIFQ